jgi:hypothetical protein
MSRRRPARGQTEQQILWPPVETPEPPVDTSLPSTREGLLAVVRARHAQLAEDIRKAGTRGQGALLDSYDREVAWVRGQLEGDYILFPIAALWGAAAALNVEGLPRWSGEPTEGPQALQLLDDLAAALADRDTEPPGGARKTPPAVAGPDLPAIPDILQLLPGGFVYRKRIRSDLPGKPWDVLAALVRATHHRLRAHDAYRDIWSNRVTECDLANVGDAVGTVRDALKAARKRAHVKKTGDPVPCKDSGRNLCWELDLGQL